MIKTPVKDERAVTVNTRYLIICSNTAQLVPLCRTPHACRRTMSGAGARPWEVHAGQGLKVGLYTPTILDGNSHLSWFYDREAIKDRAHTGTSKGLSQAINGKPIRKSLPKYANIYVTIQSHGLSAGARPHYVTGNGGHLPGLTGGV